MWWICCQKAFVGNLPSFVRKPVCKCENDICRLQREKVFCHQVDPVRETPFSMNQIRLDVLFAAMTHYKIVENGRHSIILTHHVRCSVSGSGNEFVERSVFVFQSVENENGQVVP